MEKFIDDKETEKKELEKSTSQSSCSNNLGSDVVEVFQETDKPSSENVFVVERVVNGSVRTIKSSRPSLSSESEDIPSKHTSVPVTSEESSKNIQAAKSGIQIVKEKAVDYSEEPEICDDLEVIAEISATAESPSEQDSVLKSKKGPLPGLLPLEQNSSTSNSPEVQMPHKIAMRSTEKIKAVDQAVNSNSQPKGNKDVGKETCSDTNGVRLCDSLQDHIVIEPDIEIHTLSDEFQMEFEDSEASPAMNSLSSVVATTFHDQTEKLARETLACWSCRTSLYDRTDALLWESMEFCSEKCLKTYMKVIGSHCNMCNAQVGDNILGKLCVRFGTVIRQFCTADCLEKFKGSHKLCATCQVNMSNKEKTHCSPVCEELARRLANKTYYFGRRFCSVCNELKEIQEEVYLGGRSHWLCSKPCLNAFRFSNKVMTLTCETCSRGFDINATPRFVSRNANKGLLTHHVTLSWYCSNVCFAIHLIRKRKIELCARCQVKKYNVDMIRKPTGDTVFSKTVQDKSQLEAQMIFFCSLYCFTHYPIPISREPARRKANSNETALPAASTVAPTVVSLQSLIVESPLSSQSRSLIQHTTLSNPISLQASVPPRTVTLCNLPAISTQVTPSIVTNTTTTASSATGSQPPANASMLPIELQHKIVLLPPKPKEMKNKSVWCRPSNLCQSEQIKPTAEKVNVELSKGVGCDASTSTDEERKPLYIPVPIPIPVPIYVPVPMAMYNFPSPFPVAFPMPVVTPFILPVGSHLLDEAIKAMGEAKKKETGEETVLVQENNSPVQGKTIDAKYDRESTDVSTSPNPVGLQDLVADDHVDVDPTVEEVNFELEIPSCSISSFRNGSRKRSHSTSHFSLPATKRLRDIDCSRSSSDSEESTKTSRSDSPSLHLKGGFQKEAGVRAWKNWTMRNENKRLVDCKFCEMSVVDMNTSLIAFVQQIRKPDGDRYRPDILLYLISGLQESLAFGADFRRQNLLMDAALLPFQIELDKHLQPFYDALLKGINSGGTMELTTCLKESHLWKCRQLGVDSPIVLVFTMLYFNTKYFRLYTAEQHLQMSFANVQKVPKKIFPSVGGISNGGSTGKNAAKIFSLQFDDTQTQQEATVAGTMDKVRRKKPLDMPQNVDYLPHCPVKIYNFYVSKCPEDAKTRKDLFYLLPDSSCAPESPVWYTSQPVPREILARMLRRVLLVEEVLHNLCSLD
ncbi:zinc finger MYM-type protein 3-like [Daphnia carinata]|uniref:zinc finger MYM-type protein 3-like n=1 Tax=Daphnia carinata TaxID=120202 RepID=UPI0025808113|nr:zinc finger MYM-type protein 3-like [Daphnia carinata]